MRSLFKTFNYLLYQISLRKIKKFWTGQQGENEYGIKGTCGIATTAIAINIKNRKICVNENEVLAWAMKNKKCDKEGGTNSENILDILNHYDINAVEETWSKCSVYDIKKYLENKKVVLCAVDSSALWEKQNGKIADHCILISGIYSYKNKIEKITIFDTGVGEVHNYNVEKFINAYEVIDGCCIVLD